MTELELIRCLNADEPRDRLAIKAWLTRTDPAQAADMLMSVMEQCRPGPLSKENRQCIRLVVMLSGLLFTAIFLTLFAAWQLIIFPAILISLLYLLYPIGHPEGRQRAALLLASLDDARAVAGLAASWVPMPETSERWERNEGTEAELSRLLTIFTRNPISEFEIDHEAVENVLRRTMTWWCGEAARTGRPDLSDSRADMLLAVVRWMGQRGTAHDVTLLHEIANLPLPPAPADNHAAVRDAAALLAAPAQAEETTSVLISAPQTLGHRS